MHTTAQGIERRLHRARLRRLVEEWHRINWSLFDSRLRPPAFELRATERILAQWIGGQRRIVFSERALLERPWTQVIEILKHEIAHQYVDELLGGDGRPHGELFREVCRARGICPAAVDRQQPAGAPAAEDRVVAKIRKLLALAGSANQHEAELAAAAAQRLMLRHNLEVEAASPPAVGEPEPVVAWLGAVKGRTQAHEYALAGLLASHFFVRTIWIPSFDPRAAKPGQVLEICGRPENVQIAEFVHGFLIATIERLWREHKRAHRIDRDRDRRSFLVGAIDGFAAKLADQGRQLERQGLVWTGAGRLDDFQRRRHPRVRSVRRGGPSDAAAYGAGHQAGRAIVLHRPVHEQGDGPPRALPRGRT